MNIMHKDADEGGHFASSTKAYMKPQAAGGEEEDGYMNRFFWSMAKEM